MKKVDVVENLCKISGRVFSFNFDTEPLIENEWRFKAENKDKGIKIEIQFNDLNQYVSVGEHKIMCQINLI
jgi:hypothetical protein